MIPKLIHQTAKTSELPADCRKYVDTLKTLHPDWNYKLWTDADNLAFVQREFPDFFDIFVRLSKGIMRADVIRYLLMYRVGGLYLDTDYEMLKPFDLYDRSIVLCWEPDPLSPTRNGKLANSIFASSPGHPFFGMVIDELRKNPPLSADLDVETVTGPGLMTRVHQTAVEKGVDLYAAPPWDFNPITPRSQKEYRAIVNAGVAYGIHHCHGSWRQFTWYQQLRMKIASSYHGLRSGT